MENSILTLLRAKDTQLQSYIENNFKFIFTIKYMCYGLVTSLMLFGLLILLSLFSILMTVLTTERPLSVEVLIAFGIWSIIIFWFGVVSISILGFFGFLKDRRLKK